MSDAPSLLQRFQTEGVPYYLSNSLSLTSPTVGNTVSSSTLPSLGKVALIEEITVSVSEKATVRFNIGGPSGDVGSAGFTSRELYASLAAGGTHSWHPNWILRGFMLLSAPVVFLTDLYGQTLSSMRVSWNLTGHQIADDLNFNAAKTMLFVGDSLLDQTGISASQNSLAFLTKDYFNGLGSNARIVLKTVAGATTTNHESWRQQYFLDGIAIDMLVYFLGPNDYGQSVARATSLANVTAMWNWLHACQPQAKMLILGPSPMELDAQETAMQAIRDDQAAFVAGVNNPLLKFITLAGAFDRKNTSFYVTTDPSGSHVHMVDRGHLACFANNIQPGIISQGITL